MVPKKKNVVVVLDTSGSMKMAVNGIRSPAGTPSKGTVAREAAMTVIGTLSATDHVGVVTFNSNALSSMCSPHQNSQGIHMMVPATSDNLDALQDLINSSLPTGFTNYGNAFSKAFQLLSRSKQIHPKQFEESLDMILFLTDGTPDDKPDDILEEIAKGQALMTHSVHVFVYALGDEIFHTETPESFLIQLADQNNLVLNNSFRNMSKLKLKWPILLDLQDNDKPAGPVGNIFFVDNSEGHNLARIMGEYYSHFQANSSSNVTFSVPHREPITGVKMTLSLPTLDSSGRFFGVAAVDVLLELTFYEVAHFHLGKDSYAFLVGNSGVVYLHPELAVGGRDLDIYTVDQLEPGLSAAAIYNITNGLEGQDIVKKSVDQVQKAAVCYYRPLSGFSSDFMVALVIFEDDIKQKQLQSADSNSFPDFLYHRQGFINTTLVGHEDVCYRDQALVILANATIKFAPGSFWDLEKSLMYEQNKSYSEAHNIFKNTTGFSQHAGVTESVAGDVLLMNKIDDHWKIPTDAIWRYIGTENGVFKVFPGTLVPDILYDPREDRWYTTAVSQSQKYVFIAHPDQNTSLVTLAKAFHQTSKSVHGVIAADITVQHLMTYLFNAAIKIISKSSAWIILDDEGSVLLKLDHGGPVQISSHLTEALPGVANWLLQKGDLQINWCSDVQSGHSRLTYSLDTSGSVVDPGSSDPCLDFQVVPIHKSNLYVIIYKPSSTCHAVQTSCSCTEVCSVCDHLQKNICQCPCMCFSNYLDRCTHQINKTEGYRPCPGPHKHWQMQSMETGKKSSSVKPCKPVCTAISGAAECQATKGCNWCSGGHYKNLPLCSEKCVKDRVEVHFRLPCEHDRLLNFTARSTEILDVAQKRLSQFNKAVVQLKNSSNDTTGVTLLVGTRDETEIPQGWISTLSAPVHVVCNDSSRNIVYITGFTESTDARVEFIVRTVNLTRELETALTLRNYIQKVVQELVKRVTELDIADTISGLWLEEDKISFWLERPKNSTRGYFAAQLQKLKLVNDTELTLLDRNVTISNVSVSESYSSLCPAVCGRSTSSRDCQKDKDCFWDRMYHECTVTPVLPERIRASVYLPCLGLYWNVSSEDEHQVLQEFEEAVRNMTGLSDKELHSFEVFESNKSIGQVLNFTVQGIMNRNRVSAIWWDLRTQLDRDHNFTLTVGIRSYRSSTEPTSDEQITNMEINVEFISLDTEEILQNQPLTARKVIEQEVVKMAKKTLSPMVVKTISNIAFKKSTIQFMVSKSPQDPRDLFKEYRQFWDTVEQGQLNITLFNTQYTANSTFIIGSFGELCPRQCHDGHTEAACSTIPGCYWLDQSQKCADDALLPEKKQVTVVFPCSNFDELICDERNRSLMMFRDEVDKFVQGLPTGARAHSFSYGDDFKNSFTFLVQGTARRAPLSGIVANISKWISAGQLQLVVNNSHVIGQDVEDFNSVEIAMLFPQVEFSVLDLQQRRKLKEGLFHHLRSYLSLDFSVNNIHNVWFDQKYVIFKVERNNLNSSVSKEIEKWKQVLQLKAFSMQLGPERLQPAKMVYQASLVGYCPISCFNSSINSLCKSTQGCFYNGKWNVDLCHEMKLISNSFVYPVFVACNITQGLSASEIIETEQDLRTKLETILGEAKEVLQDAIITQEGVDVTLHATSLHPHLELYVDMLEKEADYTKGFSFGPLADRKKFSPRKKEDSTNVEVVLKFRSIDLEALQNLHLTTRQEITEDLQRQLDGLLVGEVARSFNLTWIHQDRLSFELKKSATSTVNMAKEMDKILNAVKNSQITLHIHYIRPIVATELYTVRTFKELCHEKYRDFSSVPPVMTTVDSLNISFTSVPTNKPELIVIYNASEISYTEAQAIVIDTVNTCLVEIHSCEYCSSHFSRDSCSFDAQTTASPESTTYKADVTTTALNPDDQINFGAVTITIMVTSGCFLWALALWAADYVRKATTKKSKFKRKARRTEIEETQQ
ncbi:uncharacterized protein LOC125654160 [Ostrea edulis]|uniref:uncharacterized protein LOC125654160 n=1 Tax=Ostrea edulis TaxID=37623 RepID=UPI0024AEDD5B|nr:uncharacterized protein LOC125654160 [Ostrea edulis]